MSTTIDWIASAVEAIITTRDFCGDEKEALREVESSKGSKFTPSERDEIRQRVAGTWKDAQNAAGVTRPIHPSERPAIARALRPR